MTLDFGHFARYKAIIAYNRVNPGLISNDKNL